MAVRYYTGYPALEQVAMDGQDRRLKPRRGLHVWYLGEAFHGEPLRVRSLLSLWGDRAAASGLRGLLAEGMGAYWETAGRGWVRLSTPRELHSRLHCTWRTQRRPVAGLWTGTVGFNQHLTECHVLSFIRDEEGLSEPVTRAEIADSLGLCEATVRTHLANSHALVPVPQYLKLADSEHPTAFAELSRRYPAAHLRYLDGVDGIYRRLPDRFRSEQADPPGWRRTPLGEILRSGALPESATPDGMAVIWDGTRKNSPSASLLDCQE